MPSAPSLVQLLAQATAGLRYPSESDEPLSPILLPPAPTALDALRSHVPKKQLAESSFPLFFADLESADDAPKFRALRALLESRLTDLHVFRGSPPRVDVYVLGRTTTGAWAGFHTISIET